VEINYRLLSNRLFNVMVSILEKTKARKLSTRYTAFGIGDCLPDYRKQPCRS
jgi:hypothetical protein